MLNIKRLIKSFDLTIATTALMAIILVAQLAVLGDYNEAFFKWAFSAMIVVQVACLAVIFITSRYVRHEINQCTTGVNHLIRGDYGHSIPVSSRDELGKLAESLNTLSHILRDGSKENLPVANAVKIYASAFRSAEKNLASMKNSFLLNISHEIRTPLSSILGYIDLLLEEEARPSDRARIVEAIHRNGDRLTALIDDILDLGKIETGKILFHKTRFRLREVLFDMEDQFRVLATQKGLDLTFTVQRDVPEEIMSDPKRLKQALSYLVSNAIKFTQVGSVNIEACLRNFDADEHRLAFIIKDSGAGINKEQAKKLFLPFAQADSSSTRVFAGTGLGLILARKLAQGLGGDVVLQESSVNSGSVFVFTIDPGKLEVPMAQNEEKSSNIQVDPTPSVPRLDGKSVLIVEDSADLQLLFSHFLLASGAKVETANNGAEGVEKALSGDYHIVLMDLQMPIMDGHEALQVLKKNHFAKPVIALTAHARNEERIKCLENGFIEHLAKPVNRESLIKAVWQQTYATPSHPHESIN